MQRCVPSSVHPTLSAYCVQVVVNLWTRGPCSQPCSPPCCISHSPFPFNPQALPAPPLLPRSRQGLEPSWAGLVGVPGGALSGLLRLPTSLVALRQLYGGRIEAVSLLAGLFLHFSSPALIFPCRPSWSPTPPPGMSPLPPPLICQPSQERGPLASKVIELLGGETGQGFLRECFWLPALRGGWGRGYDGGDCGLWFSKTALLSLVWA